VKIRRAVFVFGTVIGTLHAQCQKQIATEVKSELDTGIRGELKDYVWEALKYPLHWSLADDGVVQN